MSGWHVLADPRDVVPELTNRIVVLANDDRPKQMPSVEDSEDVYDLLRTVEALDREAFWVLPLDDDDQLIGMYLAHLGGPRMTIVDPSVVMRLLLITEATKFIIVHNHPSGDSTPSPEDRGITYRLLQASALFGVRLVDHVVIGRDDRYSSFRDLGWLQEMEERASA